MIGRSFTSHKRRKTGGLESAQTGSKVRLVIQLTWIIDRKVGCEVGFFAATVFLVVVGAILIGCWGWFGLVARD